VSTGDPMQLRIIIISLFILLSDKTLFSQNNRIQYSKDFQFTDGIYKAYEEFKNNDPSIREDALISENPNTRLLIGNFAKVDRIAYRDKDGSIKKLSRMEVWGYCSKGTVYVMLGNNFHRIAIIGSIMHFTESFNKLFYDPKVPISTVNKPKRYIQYMIDYTIGVIYPFDLEYFLPLLKRDNELYTEFISIKSSRKKKQKMFIYLNKFNERNPVYFKMD
jgi:hypothetical protein